VVRASLLSLPVLLDPSAGPPAAPYLRAPDADRGRAAGWLRSLGPGLTVGLCWAGGSGYRFDRRRSLRLDALAPLAAVSPIRFVSLQQGEAASQPPPPALELARFPGPDGDLAQTAALIAELDLVVSVDTAIAHLAGALGRPVWLLNRFGGDWRWQAGFTDARGHSLWYPTLRQFRQTAPLPPAEAWLEPIRTVTTVLGEAALRSAGSSSG
jgi:hypothetical protein